MKRVCVSFSGGETSGRMLHFMRQTAAPGTELVVTLANTGEEDEATLTFADRIDREWDAHIVWLEAVVNPEKGEGTTHRVVSYETASRKGEPFEDVVRKYGLPGPGYLHCTRELKLQPITSYLRSIGWEKGTYLTAIGIRADEMDRIDPGAREKGLIYPLVHRHITKGDIQRWWEKQPFRLGLPEHRGNCKWCWKKSLRKHLTIIKESPEVFDFPRRMEQIATGGADRMFRDGRNVNDLFKLADLPFAPFTPTFDPQLPLLDLDLPNGDCSESCEPYSLDEAA